MGAATWRHTLKREPVAATLRALAEEHYPDDGYVAYYLGRHYDFDAEVPTKAMGFYKKAVKQLPNNPKILQEFILFLDMVAQDKKTLKSLVSAREKDRGPGYPLPFLEPEGNGVGNLLCEASITAKQLGLQRFSDAMWEKALNLAPLSSCIKTNWPICTGSQTTTMPSTVSGTRSV